MKKLLLRFASGCEQLDIFQKFILGWHANGGPGGPHNLINNVTTHASPKTSNFATQCRHCSMSGFPRLLGSATGRQPPSARGREAGRTRLLRKWRMERGRRQGNLASGLPVRVTCCARQSAQHKVVVRWLAPLLEVRCAAVRWRAVMIGRLPVL